MNRTPVAKLLVALRDFHLPRACGLFAVCLLSLLAAAAWGRSAPSSDAIVQLLELVIEADTQSARKCMATLSGQLESGEFSKERLKEIQPRLAKIVEPSLADSTEPLHFDAALMAVHWNDQRARKTLLSVAADAKRSQDQRLAAAKSLLATHAEDTPLLISQMLRKQGANPASLRARLISEVAKASQTAYARSLLSAYAESEADLQPRIVEALLQRAAWSKLLLQEIGKGRVARGALHANQVAQLQASPDKALAKLVRDQWGVVRQQRDPKREQVLASMRSRLATAPGDADRGQLVFGKLCGQCHAIYGKGPDVGPDITRNGRGSYEQLLSNVFDPNLVIGASYQARTVITAEGRVLTGLLAEDNAQRVVLKMQGGKREVIPRDQVEEMRVSPLSLMPENLEQQLKPEEIADLFAFLTLDLPPQNPQAKRIPGSPSFTKQ